MFIITQSVKEIVCPFLTFLLNSFVEEMLDWEDDNDPSNEFWSSIKGGLKEKVRFYILFA